MRRLRATVLLACSLCACSDSRVLWRGDATLGSSEMLFPSAASFRVVGPGRAICVVPANDTAFGKHPVQLDVYLVRRDGTRDRLGWRPDTSHIGAHSERVVTPEGWEWRRVDTAESITPGRPPRMHDYGGVWCAEDWEGARYLTRYRAVAIRSSSALHISEVQWMNSWPAL
jgi:hypothetical protein